MSNYRRAYVAGGSFFFTLVTERRAPIFRSQIARTCLGTALRDCQKRWSFRVDALVLLDDHLHAMWTLPDGDTDYSMRWGFIKKEFTKAWLLANGIEQPRSKSRVQQRRRGVWQRRFWEHTLRNENDYARHFDYLHYNPVKHGYVERVRDWHYSTFHRWVKQGVYDVNWGCSIHEPGRVRCAYHIHEHLLCYGFWCFASHPLLICVCLVRTAYPTLGFVYV